MRKKPGAVGWGKSAFGNKTKSAAHNAHRKHMKQPKVMKNQTTKGGMSVGNLSGVGVRGWVNG